jgi:hypothetical protein
MCAPSTFERFTLTGLTSMQPTRFAFSIAAIAFLAACGDSTGPDQTALTVDEVFSDIEEVQSITAATTIFAGAPMPSHAMPLSAACAFSSTTQSFVCPTTTSTGLTFARSFQLFDASGAVQSEYSPATTDAVRAVSDASGTLTNQNGSVTFTSHDDYTVSGLLTSNLTLDGEGASQSIITNDEDETVTVDATTTIDGLVIPKRRSGNRYPQAGTIDTDITFTNEGGQSTDVSIGIAFNGSSLATMTMSTGLGTVTCLIDLSRQNKAPNCS